MKVEIPKFLINSLVVMAKDRKMTLNKFVEQCLVVGSLMVDDQMFVKNLQLIKETNKILESLNKTFKPKTKR